MLCSCFPEVLGWGCHPPKVTRRGGLLSLERLAWQGMCCCHLCCCDLMVNLGLVGSEQHLGAGGSPLFIGVV